MDQYLNAALSGGGSDLGSSSVKGILDQAAVAFVLVGLGVSFIFIAFAFVQYIISAGDPKAIERAQRALTWSLLAFGVSALAGTISSIMFKIMGIQ